MAILAPPIIRLVKCEKIMLLEMFFDIICSHAEKTSLMVDAMPINKKSVDYEN